jgi:hypothetical protein
VIGVWPAAPRQASRNTAIVVIVRVMDLLRVDVQSLIGLAWLSGIQVALPRGVAVSQDNKQHGGVNDLEQQS